MTRAIAVGAKAFPCHYVATGLAYAQEVVAEFLIEKKRTGSVRGKRYRDPVALRTNAARNKP